MLFEIYTVGKPHGLSQVFWKSWPVLPSRSKDIFQIPIMQTMETLRSYENVVAYFLKYVQNLRYHYWAGVKDTKFKQLYRLFAFDHL